MLPFDPNYRLLHVQTRQLAQGSPMKVTQMFERQKLLHERVRCTRLEYRPPQFVAVIGMGPCTPRYGYRS